MKTTFESLPVELIADILSELDLESLIKVSYLSRRLYQISSDPSLNPWRRPILCNLQSNFEYEKCLKNLCVRWIVPRQNWIEIMSIARPAYLLYEATLPNLSVADWEECFKRRFLPGWRKWKKDGGWKEAFMKLLQRVWHRSTSNCTVDEAWTKYIVLNRNGSANQLELSSRNFNPSLVFDEMKLQNDLAHLETRVRLVVEFADVRILAFGTLNKPRTNSPVNPNAKLFLHPPGIEVASILGKPRHDNTEENTGVNVGRSSIDSMLSSLRDPPTTYTRLLYPLPALSYSNYPFHTPGGGDKRWLCSGGVEEEGLTWVGSMLITAQLLGSHIHESSGDWPPLQDVDLVVGPGRAQYASFTWPDLWSIAPWLEEKITKKIDGIGLGI